ncbi:BTAD domain-containing putative transcriptional regulator [Nocardia vaccinii]|uniref:BTAD domain-containing putative transcriptional regulator n=1 Tax=Nocardia vaccinii TaxID=1822 RepID=UPI0008335F25|nr:BTAD domain-containing putative transcriptional regulator [Nocardia vaccinii]
MAPTTSHTIPASVRPLLIAVTGLGPGTGVTTTTVALARAWPGPDAAVVVEADPRGGQLAQLAGVDPYRGLASLARAARSPNRRVRIAEHVQLLPGGVGLLASPPGADARKAGWVTTLLTGREHDRRLGDLAAWRAVGASVFADCGTAGSGSALDPIVALADACLIVLDTDLTDPGIAGQQIRDLAARSGHPGVLLIGAAPDSDYATALEVPVLAGLPREPQSATALLAPPRLWPRRNRLLRAAHPIAASVELQLRPPAATPPITETPARPRVRRRPRVLGRRPAVGPRVYRIELPTGPAAAPDSADTDPNPSPAPTPPAGTRPAQPTASGATDRDIGAAAAPRGVVPCETPSGPPPPPAPRPPSRAPDAGAAEPGLAVRIFGPTRVLWRTADSPRAGVRGVEITRSLQPRSRELLTVLALHPDGLSRGDLIDALWGQRPPDRPGIALTNALGRLRGAVATATGHQAVLLIEDRPRYRLDPAAVTVDYWEFTAAVVARRQTSAEAEHIAASRRILDIASATATLAADLSDPWVEQLREAARHSTLNALGWLANHTLTQDPRTTLGMLETAVETDPYNEPVWQDILRLHAKLGEYDALTRTYSLLTRKLAEIDATPSPQTRQLLEQLRRTTR